MLESNSKPSAAWTSWLSKDVLTAPRPDREWMKSCSWISWSLQFVFVSILDLYLFLPNLYSLRFLEVHPEGMAKETVFIGTRFLGLELLLHLKNYNVKFLRLWYSCSSLADFLHSTLEISTKCRWSTYVDIGKSPNKFRHFNWYHLVCIHRCFTKAFHKVLTFLYFDHLKVLFANMP